MIWGYAGDVPPDDHDVHGGSTRTVSVVAAEAIPPGRVVVLDPSGKLALPTAPLARVAGVSLRHRSGRSWEPGEQVPVMRRGRVFVATVDSGRAYVDQAYVCLNADDAGKVTTDPGATDAALNASLDGAVYAGALLAEINLP